MNTEVFLSTIPVMVAGMGGVFGVIIAIWVSIVVLTKAFGVKNN